MCYVGNTNHCVYIYVFVNVYVAIAVYFLCLEEIIYKTKTNGKETKLGRPDFANSKNLTIIFVTLVTVLFPPPLSLWHSLSPVLFLIFFSVEYANK